MDVDQAKGETYEEQHVHGVYEQIASHFSSTRYKPWPIIERFLKELPNGSIGLDIGCGNGKYLSVNPHIFILASDRSSNLATIAKRHHAPHSVIVADLLHLPHPPHAFDFAISIAVVHHLSTPARRVEALESILQTLRPGGKALITVWALEQESSRRGWSEGDDQDVMVPWVMRGSKKGAAAAGRGGGSGRSGEDRVFNRYYHLYRKGELERDVESAGGEVVEGGWERDNWWVVARPRASTVPLID
ncbi:tRNA methyltransferase, has a role in tRNA modification [Friedmanniomyces endolithicus]|uniref:tRNA methyltransferase, has a role in tRNA modification n=1 Tax=Friedmanniomyces endolithicus TaxID=329885 RepID=A0AAN6F7N7_9PEZI|nr:tRNA methyltransferase, has a role in tRNA modification [Friedmanniomyces endolithicus]